MCLSASSSVISDGCPATLHVSFEYIDWAICKPFISFKEPLKTGNHSLPPAHLCVSSPVYTLSYPHAHGYTHTHKYIDLIHAHPHKDGNLQILHNMPPSLQKKTKNFNLKCVPNLSQAADPGINDWTGLLVNLYCSICSVLCF